MAETQTDKLELFEQEIMQRAAAEKDEILRATEDQKRDELGQEESRLLEEYYRKIQARIAEIKTATLKDIARETIELKKQLYRQREQYLTELLARTRVELSAFVKSVDYEGFLLGKVEALAQEHRYEGSALRLRPADLDAYATRVRELYGDCVVEPDEGISIGGVILQNTARGVEVDYSLDTALSEQRSWFYCNSNFNFDEAGETA